MPFTTDNHTMKIKEAVASFIARRAARQGSVAGMAGQIMPDGEDDTKSMISAFRRDVAPITYSHHRSKRSMDEEVVRRFAKLASMIGVTNMVGRKAGQAGISMSQIKGRALSTSAVNPRRSVHQAMSKFSPKVS